MIRRDFVKSSLAVAALAAGNERLAASPRAAESAPFPKAPGLTKYVSEFIVNTKYGDIPADVLELGRKSILDGFGLALAGSASVMAPELSQRSGKDFMLAYHLGVEVESKIAEAIDPRHYNDGFHSTGTCGSFGSAAACARLRGLDAQKTAYALGVAAAEGGGLRDNFGSMTKPFHAGHAAENGTVAVDLAALGWTAAPDILEGALGFFQAAGGGFDPGSIVNRLGNPWTFASPGVSIKPFPSGSLTHPAMGEMLGIIRKNDLKPADVEKIDIGTSHNLTTTLYHHRPTTGLQAKFSMEFGLSILLLDRKAGLNEYTDAVVQRPDVQEMIKRVNFYVDPEAEAAGFDKMTSLLKVHLKDGRVIPARADFAKGGPANPMSFEEVADKFRGCADFAKWPKEKAESVINFVKTLEAAPDMSKLTGLLTS
ncbi:MAG: MmgE/PrpD family protein [Acidobacteria bacterium]|nr:MAG: MmgE/PrpD family protein [Acidobacteriota bacterium]